MKKIAIAGFVAALLSAASSCVAQEGVTKEHEWLRQFVGEWEAAVGAEVGPKGPEITESVRALGARWIVAESRLSTMDPPMTAMLTLGYDPRKKKYVGTWIDSATSYLWTYEGTVDAAGRVITLEAEGPNPLSPGKLFKFRDVYELKGRDHKVLTSSMQGADGKWVTFVTVHYRRKK